MGIAIFLIVAFVVIIFISIANDSNKKNERKSAIDSQVQALSVVSPYEAEQAPFTATQSVVERNERFRVLIDERNEKVAIITPETTHKLDFADIMSVEMHVNGDTVASRSFGSMLGASMVGGVIGAMAVDQKIEQKVNNIHVDVHTRSLSCPVITLTTQVGEDIYFVSENKKCAQDVVNLLSVVIDHVERSQKAAQVEAAKKIESQSSQTTSAADEIRKFKQLLDDGIITEQEFNEKKAELLGK